MSDDEKRTKGPASSFTSEDFRRLVEAYNNELNSGLRSQPSTSAITSTIVASGLQPLSQYNIPQNVITDIAQEQARQVIEKNIIPIIEKTAKTTIQEHDEQEKARENTISAKAKRGGNEILWILVGIVLTAVVTVILRALGIQFL